MGSVVRRVLAPVLARLGSRAILTIGGTLFVLNMIIPDPLPLIDEFLILAGTILLSRWASSAGDNTPPPVQGEPKHVGRGSTH
jgi:hypothetical protein